MPPALSEPCTPVWEMPGGGEGDEEEEEQEEVKEVWFWVLGVSVHVYIDGSL